MLMSRGASPVSPVVREAPPIKLHAKPRDVDPVFNPEPAVGNTLLAALDASELRELSQYFECVPLRRRQVLQERNLPITHAYFIGRGLASMLSRAGERGSVEVGTVGANGFVGVPLVLGTLRSPHRCVVQVSGEAIRISAEVLQRAMKDIPRLRTVLLGYTQAAMVETAQLVVCNTRHSLQKRLARALLLAHDRLGTAEIPLTHECLSRLLGVRRAGVTTAGGQMERAGLIRRGRGRLVITDIEGLQEASCECHRAIRAEYDRILRPAGHHDARIPPFAQWTTPAADVRCRSLEQSSAPC